jgi:hypothetical protein
LSPNVTFNMLADFCSRCGRVVFIKKVDEKLLVEIDVEAATAAAFVAKFGKYFRIYNTTSVIQTSYGNVITDKSEKWKVLPSNIVYVMELNSNCYFICCRR